MEWVKVATDLGPQGLLLVAVFWLAKVVVYLNKRREEQEERYIVLIREMGAMLAQLKAHLEDAHE